MDKQEECEIEISVANIDKILEQIKELYDNDKTVKVWKL